MIYSKELLQLLVNESVSIAEIIRKLGLKPSGSTHKLILSKIDSFNIDITNLIFKRNFVSKRSINDYLDNKYPIHSDTLKKRLFKEGIKTKICESCGISKWMNVELTFELHHIDCNHNNNNLSNLKILCPNCHWLEHNIQNNDRKKSNKIKSSIIGNPKLRPKQRKVERPSYDVLLKEINETNYSAVGRKYGVSDNAVRKWVKIYEKHNSPYQTRTDDSSL